MQSFISQKNGKLSKIALDSVEGLSYALLMKILRKKDVKINGARVNKDIALRVGDKVELYFVPLKKDKFSVIFEDENVLIIDKKSGFSSEEIFDELRKNYDEIYFIHRLDRNTSGVMIFALNIKAEGELLEGFKNRTFIKEYLTEVAGKMPKKSQILSAYLLKDSENSLVKIYDKKVAGSVEISTGYEVLFVKENSSVLKVRLYTGKTHQIRAHLSYEGHAIIGDGKYGDNIVNKSFNAKSQRLIAKWLTLKFNDSDFLYYLNDKTFISSYDLEDE